LFTQFFAANAHVGNEVSKMETFFLSSGEKHFHKLCTNSILPFFLTHRIIYELIILVTVLVIYFLKQYQQIGKNSSRFPPSASSNQNRKTLTLIGYHKRYNIVCVCKTKWLLSALAN
jgi:hypothetical protein